MKAEIVYEVMKELDQKERKRFFQLIQKPMPKELKSDWIHTWESLSDYFGGISIRTLQRYEKAGIIKKYRLGKKVMFKRSDVEQAVVS